MRSSAERSDPRRARGAADRSPGQGDPRVAPADPEAALPPHQELFRLDEACRLTGLQPAAIRTWAREAPAVAPAPASNGQLFLTRRQVLMLARAQRLAAAAGLAPAEALQRVQDSARATTPAPVQTPLTPRDGSTASAPRTSRPPWEDTQIRNLVDERLEPILADLNPRPPARRE